jgi:DNA-binding response OmpR family regulator
MRILIVEDEQPLRSGLEDLLAAAGHEVVAVADGRAALDTGLAMPFDLVVLDLMLPGVGGIEVCRRLRQARPEIGVLMLTARGAEDDKVAGFAAGADDYVAKPFGVRELLAAGPAAPGASRSRRRSSRPQAAASTSAATRPGEALSRRH